MWSSAEVNRAPKIVEAVMGKLYLDWISSI
jgi:hypothetical protein